MNRVDGRVKPDLSPFKNKGNCCKATVFLPPPICSKTLRSLNGQSAPTTRPLQADNSPFHASVGTLSSLKRSSPPRTPSAVRSRAAASEPRSFCSRSTFCRARSAHICRPAPHLLRAIISEGRHPWKRFSPTHHTPDHRISWVVLVAQVLCVRESGQSTVFHLHTHTHTPLYRLFLLRMEGRVFSIIKLNSFLSTLISTGYPGTGYCVLY